MAEQYDYGMKSITVDKNKDPDPLVGEHFDSWQNQGWEYVSGPIIERVGDEVVYRFLVRKKK